MVTDVLLVMQVLLLELGGALCLALIPSVSPAISVAGNSNSKLLIPMVDSSKSDLLAKRLGDGPLVGRQRDLAALFDLPVSTFRRRVESNPAVRMTATATGSRLELVA